MSIKNWHRSKNIGEALTFALRGIQDIFVREQNVRIQALVGTLVVCTMLFLRLPLFQMAILIIMIIFVITLEMINTSLELFSDSLHPQYSETIKSVKDMLAGSVLLASIGACIVGILILAPAFYNYLYY